MKDLKKECIECHAEFLWSAKEQEWYKEKGLLPPKRCRDCRAENRARRSLQNEQTKP